MTNSKIFEHIYVETFNPPITDSKKDRSDSKKNIGSDSRENIGSDSDSREKNRILIRTSWKIPDTDPTVKN